MSDPTKSPSTLTPARPADGPIEVAPPEHAPLAPAAHVHGPGCSHGHGHHHHHAAQAPVRVAPKAGRNDPCPCGSGKKHKKCCGA